MNPRPDPPSSGKASARPPTIHAIVPSAVAHLTLQVKVKPGARVSSLVQSESGLWLAQVKAAPVDGKANHELVALVARHFGCPRSAVSIKSGATGRLKLVQLTT
jgi:uncharacterized protein